MRALFVLVLAIGCFCSMVALPTAFKLVWAAAGALFGFCVERELFERRNPDITNRIYSAFLVVLGLMIVLLPRAAYSQKFGMAFVLLAFAGFGAELSLTWRRTVAMKLACPACRQKVGAWQKRDLESFASWKCPSCHEVIELPLPRSERTTEVASTPYRTARDIDHRDRVLLPRLPLAGVLLPKWLGVLMLGSTILLFVLMVRAPFTRT